MFQFLIEICVYTHMCVYVGTTYMLWCAYGDERTTFENWFSTSASGSCGLKSDHLIWLRLCLSWVFLLVVTYCLLWLLLSCNLNSTLSVSRMASCYGCLLNCIWNELNQKLLGISGRDFLDQILWSRLFGTFWWQPRLKDTKEENVFCLLPATLAVSSSVFLLQHCFTNIRTNFWILT